MAYATSDSMDGHQTDSHDFKEPHLQHAGATEEAHKRMRGQERRAKE